MSSWLSDPVGQKLQLQSFGLRIIGGVDRAKHYSGRRECR
ncbi:hypothetical protein RISK_003096 [Rhodopirellula islandica]|uniref:Uncharacterized protein n=1 Tax=Rhodopirellula islandica TaxID=595434 RepID=A0A0J1BDX5_RHOIS|nr:hypothetical protein RISK_003096 [Rhodopirellula islandica]